MPSNLSCLRLIHNRSNHPSSLLLLKRIELPDALPCPNMLLEELPVVLDSRPVWAGGTEESGDLSVAAELAKHRKGRAIVVDGAMLFEKGLGGR